MISYLEGTLRKIDGDKVTIGVGGVGYEVLIPAYVMDELKRTTKIDEALKLYISFNQTERQPKPVLVGFRTELDKEFFELFISVEDIGPSLAIRALTKPVREIARNIEEKAVKDLKQLKGIGERKAEKIIASLKGKTAKYALIPEVELPPEVEEDFRIEVENVLVSQLGHKVLEARKMIEEAIKRRPGISTSEELFEEVYRGQKK
ncbi:MAG: Holliday junction ATP-dependent DNA helicase RuvA [Syntrophorhabdaceae bacterium PtaU1.Bin034]|nr:MAG: Holliday junction ATP-dependent DNA helicase RuvA [Syntrophorhabdaceae bacterium PtaU1.Bin034]